MKTSHLTIVATASAMLLSCNNMNRNGENITPEGTTTTSATNSTMEEHRIPEGTDTITSPGSNSLDLKGSTETLNKSSDANSRVPQSGKAMPAQNDNMKGQSDTHGKNTQSGDNGG